MPAQKPVSAEYCSGQHQRANCILFQCMWCWFLVITCLEGPNLRSIRRSLFVVCVRWQRLDLGLPTVSMILSSDTRQFSHSALKAKPYPWASVSLRPGLTAIRLARISEPLSSGKWHVFPRIYLPLSRMRRNHLVNELGDMNPFSFPVLKMISRTSGTLVKPLSLEGERRFPQHQRISPTVEGRCAFSED